MDLNELDIPKQKKIIQAAFAYSMQQAMEARQLNLATFCSLLSMSPTAVRRLLKFKTSTRAFITKFGIITDTVPVFIKKEDMAVHRENTNKLNLQVAVNAIWGFYFLRKYGELKTTPPKEGWKILGSSPKRIRVVYQDAPYKCSVIFETDETGCLIDCFFGPDTEAIPTCLLYNKEINKKNLKSPEE